MVASSGTGLIGSFLVNDVVSSMDAVSFLFEWNNICYNDIDIHFFEAVLL